jgi:dipeptidyl aminopeptidase/acylaminoacyl peptidase
LTQPVLLPSRLSHVERVIRIPDAELFDLSRDGLTALVLSNHTGSYQIATVPANGGPLRTLSHGSDRVSWARIGPDSQVVFTRDFGGREEHQFFQVPLDGTSQEEQISKLSGTRVFDFNWSNGGDEIVFAYATRESNAVGLLDPNTGATTELFQNRHWVFRPHWSNDDSRIAASAKMTEHPTATEIVLLDPAGKDAPVVYTPKKDSENTVVGWHPNHPWILFKTDTRGKYELALYKTDSGELDYLQGGEYDLGLDFPVSGWMPDGESVYYLATREGRTRLYVEKIDSSEEPRQVETPDGYHAGFFGSTVQVPESGEYFVFSWSGLGVPPTVSRQDMKKGTVDTLYEHFTDIALGRPEHVVYPSFDNRQIHGWFLKPPRSEGRRPTVLWIHGGPASEVADSWNPAIQSFVVAGYNLFAPNIRGSTGYGVEFQNLNIHDLGGADMKDVEEAAKYLATRPDVDPARIALVGASYGGFMTFLATAKLPNYWAAGAAIVGITDWKEMYDLSDAAYRSFIERYFGTPGENPELYADRSAINFVNNLKAPLFIWHRGNDSRCPLQPVQKFADRLTTLGKKFEMQVVWDEGHGFQKTENLVRQYLAVVQFLDRQLGPSS